MAMPRPGGKALKIAKETVPGLMVSQDQLRSPTRGPDPRSVEDRKIAIMESGAKLPKFRG